MQELKEAGLSAKYAKSVGIAVDHRRTNLSVRLSINCSVEAWFSEEVDGRRIDHSIGWHATGLEV